MGFYVISFGTFCFFLIIIDFHGSLHLAVASL